MNILTYDQEQYPLVDAVCAVLGVDDLSTLDSGGERVKRETDQATEYHARFYAKFFRMRDLFRGFVAHIAKGHVEEPYCYQAVPTFRVQSPGNYAVGEMHRDRDYNHPDGEVNFWVPLTPVGASSAVWIEDGAAIRPFPAQPGEVLIFDAVNLLHGNVINTTGKARVSFDFRCLPMSLHRDTDAATLNTGLRFVVGGYYLSGDGLLELPQ